MFSCLYTLPYVTYTSVRLPRSRGNLGYVDSFRSHDRMEFTDDSLAYTNDHMAYTDDSMSYRMPYRSGGMAYPNDSMAYTDDRLTYTDDSMSYRMSYRTGGHMERTYNSLDYTGDQLAYTGDDMGGVYSDNRRPERYGDYMSYTNEDMAHTENRLSYRTDDGMPYAEDEEDEDNQQHPENNTEYSDEEYGSVAFIIFVCFFV